MKCNTSTYIYHRREDTVKAFYLFQFGDDRSARVKDKDRVNRINQKQCDINDYRKAAVNNSSIIPAGYWLMCVRTGGV